MRLPPKNRRFAAVAILLGLALVAVFADPPQRDLVTRTVAAEPSESKSQAARQPSAAELLARLRREPFTEAVGGELFGQHTWQPPAPAVLPPAPAMPTVPAFPYRYLGKLAEQGGRAIVFLTKGENTYSVSAGATLEDVYRVERVEEEQLQLTYLPLKAPVTVRFADIPQPSQQQAVFGMPQGIVPMQPPQPQPVFAPPQPIPGVSFPKPSGQPPRGMSGQASPARPSGGFPANPPVLSPGPPLSLGSDPIVPGPIPGTPMQMPGTTMEISSPPEGAAVPGS